MMSAYSSQNYDPGSSTKSWVIPSFSAAFLAVGSGLAFSFGVFIPSITAVFDMDVDIASIVFALFLIVSAVSAYFTSIIQDRTNPRILVPIAGAVAGTGLFLTSLAGSQWQFFFGFGTVTALGVGSIVKIAVDLIREMLPKEQAILLIITAICSGMMIIIPICGWLVSSQSWDDAYLFLSVLAWITFIPMGLFTSRPKSIPFTDSTNDAQPHNQRQTSPTIGSRNSWLLSGMWFFLAFGASVILVHLISHAVLNGLSLQRASFLLIIFGAAGMVSAMATSTISDFFDRKSIAIILSFIAAIVTFWVIDSDQMWQYCVYMILFAPAVGGIGYYASVLTADSLDNTSSNIGPIILVAAGFIGAVLGAYLGGYLFESVGDYRFSLFIGAWACVLAGAFIWHFISPDSQAHNADEQADQ